MDEIKAKDRIIFSLEKELETQTGYVQKLQLPHGVLYMAVVHHPGWEGVW